MRRALTTGQAGVILLVAAVIGGGAFAVGAIPGPDGSVKSCFKKRGGQLRVIDSGKRCKRNERTLRFNQRGRAGPAGADGQPGAPGATGETGPTGPQGPSVVLGTIQNAADTTTYGPVTGSAAANTTPAELTVIVPPGGGFTATDLRLEMVGPLTPGPGTSYTFTFEKNNIPTGVACTVSEFDTGCTSPPGATATFAPGDALRLAIGNSGTPATRDVAFGWRMLP